MASAKTLCYEEFRLLARENYYKGGDVVFNCWGEKEFNAITNRSGRIAKSKAMKLFREYKEKEKSAAWFGDGSKERNHDMKFHIRSGKFL